MMSCVALMTVVVVTGTGKLYDKYGRGKYCVGSPAPHRPAPASGAGRWTNGGGRVSGVGRASAVLMADVVQSIKPERHELLNVQMNAH